MDVLSYLPLLLCVISVIAFFIAGLSLKIPLFSVFIGGFVFTQNSISLLRMGYGWYDTDPYNFVFPALILACFLEEPERLGTSYPLPPWEV